MRKLNLLIVDDNKYFLNTFRYFLEDNHSEKIENLFEASNGQDCIDILKNENIDLVFMDIDMPVMDGISATKIISESHPDTHVIAISYHNEIQYYDDILKAGAIDYLTKIEISKNKLERILKNIQKKLK